MRRWLAWFSDVAYVLLRVAAGLLFAQHGVPVASGQWPVASGSRVIC
jgi:hypothetical protein